MDSFESQKKLVQEYLKSANETLTLVGPLCCEKLSFSGSVIFVDGGANFKKTQGISIGDNDSFSGKLDIILPEQKNISDLAFVLNCIPPSIKHLSLYGFLGGRRDHEIINIGEVVNFCKSKQQVLVNFGKEVQVISQGKWDLPLQGLFSLISFEKNKIKLDGDCAYKFNGLLPPTSSQGLSNIGSGLVTIENERPLVLYYTT